MLNDSTMTSKRKYDASVVRGAVYFFIINIVIAALALAKYLAQQIPFTSFWQDLLPLLLVIFVSAIAAGVLKSKLKYQCFALLNVALCITTTLWIGISLTMTVKEAYVAGVMAIFAVTTQAVISFYPVFSLVALATWPLWGGLMIWLFLHGGGYIMDELGCLVLLLIQNASRSILFNLQRQNEARKVNLYSLIGKYKKLANTDKLTNIPNRRHAYEKLSALSVRNKSVMIAIIDVDHFKRYNDTYGHLAGDDCLVEVANCLSSSLRENDYLARYGGEEFIVILPHVNIADSRDILQRLVKNIYAMQIPHKSSQTANVVTISVGATEWKFGMSLDHALACADEALYQIKENGRNDYGIKTTT